MNDDLDETGGDANLDDVASATDNIFAVTSYVAQQPLKREFKPWHRPRKQYVRTEQWGSELERLLATRLDDDSSVRYLSLPGADLLDIRYIYERFCRYGGRTLTFLGFDDSAQPESPGRDILNVSLQQIRNLQYVSQRSDVIGDDLRRLAHVDSIAWDRAKRVGPFDVINIDLCDHIGHDDPIIDESIYNAIHQLCGLQSRSHRPWSLFITSRLAAEGFSESVFTLLLAKLRANSAICPAFRNGFAERFGDLETDVPMSEWDAEKFFNTMTVGIAKWLLGLARNMRCKFSVSSAMRYRVYGGAPHSDMISLVLRFEPELHISADPIGLATASRALPDECEQAVELLASIAAMVDIDEVLGRDISLWQALRQASGELLGQANYDVGEYEAWSDSHR